LDKNHFFSGENVSGRVTLLNPDPSLMGSLLLLRIRGAEKVFIRGGDDGGSSQFQESNVLLKSVIPLADLRTHGNVPVGTFDYKFSFFLAPDLPGSFYGNLEETPELKNSKTKADFAVYYTLKAYLDGSFSPKVSEKINLIVAKPFKQEISQIKETTDRSFKLARGKLYMTPELEKNVYVPGETFKVHIGVDNDSGRKVNDIHVRLFQELEIRAGELSVVVARKLYAEKIEGVPSHEKKEVEIDFQIREDIQPTTQCKLFECQYHLEIECELPYGKKLSSHPKIQIAMPPSTHNEFNGSFKSVWEHKKMLHPVVHAAPERRGSLTGDVGSGDERHTTVQEVKV